MTSPPTRSSLQQPSRPTNRDPRAARRLGRSDQGASQGGREFSLAASPAKLPGLTSENVVQGGRLSRSVQPARTAQTRGVPGVVDEPPSPPPVTPDGAQPPSHRPEPVTAACDGFPPVMSWGNDRCYGCDECTRTCHTRHDSARGGRCRAASQRPTSPNKRGRQDVSAGHTLNLLMRACPELRSRWCGPADPR